MYNVTCFKGLEGLVSLRNVWEDLLNKCRNQSFYNSWQWHYCFAKHLVESSISYYLVEKDRSPVAIIPLQLANIRKAGIHWVGYRFPKHSHIDLADMIVEDSEAYNNILSFFVDYLRKKQPGRWDLISFAKFCQRSNIFEKIPVEQCRIEVRDQSYYVQFDQGESLKNLLSRKNLKNIDRYIRKAQSEQGEIKLKIVSNPGEIDQAFEAFLRVEASGWKQENGSCISLDNACVAFYRELINEFVSIGDVSINLLEINGEVAAGQFCLKSGSRYNLLKIGYDNKFNTYSPGGILLKYFMEHVALQGGDCEVNLVTSPSWADRWRFSTEPVYYTEIYNNTFIGRVLSLMMWGRWFWRQSKPKVNAFLKGKTT